MIEESLKKLVSKPAHKENIIDFMARIPKPKKKVVIEGDLKSAYYESRRKKYGF